MTDPLLRVRFRKAPSDDARCGKFEKICKSACRVVERRSEPRLGELSLHILLGELRAALAAGRTERDVLRMEMEAMALELETARELLGS